MATRLRLHLCFISTTGARALLALPLAGLAAFFWAVSLGGLAALADGEWLPGSGTNLMVALTLAALLSCAALAIAPRAFPSKLSSPRAPQLPSPSLASTARQMRFFPQPKKASPNEDR